MNSREFELIDRMYSHISCNVTIHIHSSNFVGNCAPRKKEIRTKGFALSAHKKSVPFFRMGFLVLPVYFKWRKQSEFNNFSYVEETYQSCLCTTSAYITHTWWWEQSDAWLRILMKYVHIENIRTQMMFKRICIGCWYANAIATYRYIQWCGCLRQCKIYCWKRSRQRKSREKNMEKSEPVQFKNENGKALGGFGAVVYLWFFFLTFCASLVCWALTPIFSSFVCFQHHYIERVPWNHSEYSQEFTISKMQKK